MLTVLMLLEMVTLIGGFVENTKFPARTLALLLANASEGRVGGGRGGERGGGGNGRGGGVGIGGDRGGAAEKGRRG